MGLDMYLFRKAEAGEKADVWETGNEVAYWRKVNAVHNWFVSHCGGGVDECQEIPVSLEQLAGLHTTCARLLAAKGFAVRNDPEALAEMHLPTVDGFFFGGTSYDEWYWHGVQETLDQIAKVLEYEKNLHDAGKPPSEYIYNASW